MKKLLWLIGGAAALLLVLLILIGEMGFLFVTTSLFGIGVGFIIGHTVGYGQATQNNNKKGGKAAS